MKNEEARIENLELRLTPPNIFKGEVPFLTFVVSDEKNEQINVGNLWATDGKLSFEGEVEESAKIFFDHVIKLSKESLCE